MLSTMGGKGGYALARSPSDITLSEMIEAIEGPPRLTVCCGQAESGDHGEAHDCELEKGCRIQRPIRRIHASLRSFLDHVTLARIAFDDGQAPIAIGSRMRTEPSHDDAAPKPVWNTAIGLKHEQGV